MIRINKRGQGIVAAVLIILIASVIGLVVASLLGTETGSTVNYMNSVQAYFIAESGLQYYMQYLKGQAGSWAALPAPPANVVFGRGTFTITVANAAADQIDVTSTAVIAGPDGVNTVRVVTERATRGSSAPLCFAYLNYSDLQVNFTGSTGSVTGDLRSGGNVTGIPAAGLTYSGTKTPNSSITIPTAAYASYQAIAAAQGQSVVGNKTFLANTTYTGTWYVTGNVTFQNNAKLYGTIANPTSNKSISMASRTGVVIDPTQDPNNPSGNYPAIVAAGSVTGNSSTNLTIKGLVYSYSNANPSIDFRFASGFNFNGSLVTRGGVRLRDMVNATMVYNSNIMSNPPPYFSGGTPSSSGVQVSNWDETY